MFKKPTAQFLLIEFTELKKIILAENDNNWLNGIDIIIEKLKWSLDDKCTEPLYHFLDACDTWKSMNKGNGSFSDYYIWRDNFDERVRLNNELNNIKEKIWSVVNKF